MGLVTKREVAIIGIRILAIYFILQLLGSFAVPVTVNALLRGQSDPHMALFIIIGLGMGLVFSGLCWILAPKIAGIIVSPDTTQAALPTSDLQTSLFRAIGMWIFITALPQFILAIAVFIHNFQSFAISFDFRLITQALELILSVCLIFSAQQLSNLLRKLRYGSAA